MEIFIGLKNRIEWCTMSLIKVWTELDDKYVALPAKVVSSNGLKYKIKYLSVSEKRDNHNRKIYSYEDETYDITNESITEFTNSDMEIDLGFKQITDNEFIKYDSDSDADYIPSSSSDDDTSSESETCDETDNFEDEYSSEEDFS